MYIWHRRLAILLLIPLLTFSLSGLLHPLMRITRPDVAQMFYPAPAWPTGLSGPNLSSAAMADSQADSASVAGIRPVLLGQDWLVQHWRDRQQASLFLNPKTGEPVANAAQQYAEQLARYFSGDYESPVAKISFRTIFDSGYGPINRLLPVWMVELERDDRLQIYVDIRNNRLATVTDSNRRMLMQLFQWLHIWSFMDVDDPLRNTLIISIMFGCFLLGLGGIYLFAALPISKRRKAPGRKIHAWGGLLVSVALLMFVSSGLIRTLEKLQPEVRGIAITQVISLAPVNIGFSELQQRFPAIYDARLHMLNGAPVWQVLQPRQPERWISAQTGAALPGARDAFARQLASAAIDQSTNVQAIANSEPLKIERISNYKTDSDYGFIDKRLPVVALHYTQQTLYVDSRDGVLSKQVTGSTRLYGWIFNMLHKWRFADGLGLNQRDSLITVFILTICGMGILGFVLWLKRQRKQRRSRLAAAETSVNGKPLLPESLLSDSGTV